MAKAAEARRMVLVKSMMMVDEGVEQNEGP
jgi:hypothetical protein